MKEDITELYCFVDDFVISFQEIEKSGLFPSNRIRNRECNLSLSEMLTIYIHYSNSPCKNFKDYYVRYIRVFYRQEFPKLISYKRFVYLIPRLLMPLAILHHCLLGEKTGLYIVDSTKLAVCDNKRISSHKVFAGFAARGKSSMGWFFGLKLHLIINNNGELMSSKITPGNVDDRVPLMSMSKGLLGILLADRGYISTEKFISLYRRGLKMIVGIRKNMKNKLMIFSEKVLHKKRFLIETVIGNLKETMGIENSRHRSPVNAFAHIIRTLVAYLLKPKKPTMRNNLCVAAS